MPKRSKILIILGYQAQDDDLSSFDQTWNQQLIARGERPLFKPTTSMDFLLAIEKESKRSGFIEVELLPGESPMTAVRRMNPFSSAAIEKPWQEIDTFAYREHKNEWQVQLGLILVGHQQRFANLYEQRDDLPFLVEWHRPSWLYQERRAGRVNLLTSAALDQPALKEFFPTTQMREVA